MANIRVLIGNAASLFAIQIVNYILPLALLPYLSRVLEVDGFGYMVFGFASISLAGVFTDFGFDLYAPYAMHKIKGDKDKLKIFVGSVYLCKVILLCVFLGSFFATKSLWIHRMPSNDFAFALLFPVVCGAFQSVWFFQGMETMRVIMKYYVYSRVIYVALVVFLVKSPQDINCVFAAFGFANLFSAGLGYRKIVLMGFSPIFPNLPEFRRVFSEASGYFASRAAVSTYTTGGAFFLGMFSTPSQLAFYNAAEQLFRGAQGLFAPVAQALYPYMARTRDQPLFKRIFAASVAISLVGIAIGTVFGSSIISIIFGPNFVPAHEFLLFFLVILAINIPSVLLGYPYLGAMGYGSFVNWTVVFAGMVQLVMLIVLLVFDYTQAVGVLVTIFLSEIIVLLLRIGKVLNLSRRGAN